MFSLLQTYRGLAAIGVAAFHLSISFQDARYGGQAVFGRLSSKMDLGVDFFFVLSGFIIVFAHRKDLGKPSRLLSFYKKRFIRLYPIYWVYLFAFCTLIGFGFGAAAKTPDTICKWVSTITLIRLDNFLLPISPAWTLVHEVAFYFIFSLSILNVWLGALVFGIWQICCATNFEYPPPEGRTIFETYLAAYNLDFAIGILAFAIFRSSIKIAPSIWILAGAGLILVASLVEVHQTPFRASKILYAVAFGSIIAGSSKYEFRRRTYQLYFLPAIGDASYTIYLTHEAFIGLMQKVFRSVGAQAYVGASVRYLVILSGVILTGLFIHKFVERPVLLWARRATGGGVHQPKRV